MKYWKSKSTNNGEEKIVMNNPSTEEGGSDRMLSIKKCSDGHIRFREECDSYYSRILTKDQALQLLEEAIEFISRSK